ncbi:MAG: TolC family protein, partial [Planctomycetota bacterium]
AAADSYERNLRRIRDGQGIPLEVLQSLRAYEDAQREYLRAVIDYNEAQFTLGWALGWPVRAS